MTTKVPYTRKAIWTRLIFLDEIHSRCCSGTGSDLSGVPKASTKMEQLSIALKAQFRDIELSRLEVNLLLESLNRGNRKIGFIPYAKDIKKATYKDYKVSVRRVKSINKQSRQKLTPEGWLLKAKRLIHNCQESMLPVFLRKY